MKSRLALIETAVPEPRSPVRVDLSVLVPEEIPTTSPPQDVASTFLFHRQWPILWPMAFLLAASGLIRWGNLDLLVSELFYDRPRGDWPFGRAQPWLWIYRHGTIPSFVLGNGGAIVAVFGRWILPRAELRRSKAIRRAGLFLVVFLAVGPGLIVNVGFKHAWGRPRPNQCTEFNGEKSFLPVGTWARDPVRNSSFPSGHAAVAFYLMAPGFVMGQRRPRLTAASFLAGTCYGLAMGLTRVVQGGHFASDVLWAGAMVYFTGVALAWLILRNDERTYPLVHNP